MKKIIRVTCLLLVSSYMFASSIEISKEPSLANSQKSTPNDVKPYIISKGSVLVVDNLRTIKLKSGKDILMTIGSINSNQFNDDYKHNLKNCTFVADGVYGDKFWYPIKMMCQYRTLNVNMYFTDKVTTLSHNENTLNIQLNIDLPVHGFIIATQNGKLGQDRFPLDDIKFK